MDIFSPALSMSYARTLLIAMLVTQACGDSTQQLPLEAAGGKHFGGVFKLNELGTVQSLFPLDLTQVVSFRVASPIYEGLVGLDARDLTIMPALAESWQVNKDATVYTFKIRPGVRFHDDPCFANGKGREVKAEDVVWCFEQICTANERNQMFWLFQDKVLGANAHYAKSLTGDISEERVRGIIAVDDQTVRIELSSPSPGFLNIVAHQGCWIYPKEMLTHYGTMINRHAVGTGPFKLLVNKPGEVIMLERWKHYWKRDEFDNQLPFLDAIKVTFLEDRSQEVDAFLQGYLTMVDEIPVERADLLRQDAGTGARGFVAQSTPSLTVQYYAFQVQQEPFSDPLVRQAFAHAIDRSFIVDSVLKGLGVMAEHGLVPPGFVDYPYDLVRGVKFDPARAKELLAQAGYPDGKGFPGVPLQVGGGGFAYVEVAGAVQSMLQKNLNVHVPVSVLPADQYFDRIETGETRFWREGWLADHADPENFLALLYGRNAPDDPNERSYLNSTRFKDAKYDSLFNLSARQANSAERARLLALAEDRAMELLPVIPLYYERAIRLVQKEVQDLPINGLELRDMSRVWFKP